MFRSFYPDECAESAYDINYKALYKQGYQGLLFDIDNTLVEHDADADLRAIELIRELKNIGFKICLISNNDEERVKRFNKDIKVKYIYNARKPSPENYYKAMRITGTKKNTTVFIGDQLFTDIYGAKLAGIRNIFVKPIGAEKEIQIVLKRYLEKIVLYFYRKQKNDKRFQKK